MSPCKCRGYASPLNMAQRFGVSLMSVQIYSERCKLLNVTSASATVHSPAERKKQTSQSSHNLTILDRIVLVSVLWHTVHLFPALRHIIHYIQPNLDRTLIQRYLYVENFETDGPFVLSVHFYRRDDYQQIRKKPS